MKLAAKAEARENDALVHLLDPREEQREQNSDQGGHDP
jgi:hypothetical protein